MLYNLFSMHVERDLLDCADMMENSLADESSFGKTSGHSIDAQPTATPAPFDSKHRGNVKKSPARSGAISSLAVSLSLGTHRRWVGIRRGVHTGAVIAVAAAAAAVSHAVVVR